MPMSVIDLFPMLGRRELTLGNGLHMTVTTF